MKEIYFIRHAETALNRANIIQGSSVDSVLNDLGWMQAQAFYNQYQHEGFELVIVSALQRTRQTVQQFIEAGIPTVSTALINEINWGAQEGLAPTPESKAEYAATVEAWTKGDLHARMDSGESAHELKSRLLVFIEDLKQRPESKILACTHGRTMRALISLLKTGDVVEMENIYHNNTGLYKVQLDEHGFTILDSNNLTHLDGLGVTDLR